MLKVMERLEPGFRGLEARIRCFGHVLSLVVKVSFMLPLSNMLQSILHCSLQALLQTLITTKHITGASASADAEALAELEDDEDANEDELEAEEEADSAREAADEADVDAIEEEDSPSNIRASPAEMQAARLALRKVSHTLSSLSVVHTNSSHVGP